MFDNRLPVNPFKSFWMGGFECADHLNAAGERVDFLNITHHLTKLAEDYNLLKQIGISTVREGIRWNFVERVPYHYDFSTVKLMLDEGRKCGIQQIWDICHFGFPDDLSPLHPHFTKRFTGVCRAFAKFHRNNYPDLELIVTPINEVSFISWLGGEVGGTVPYCIGNGWNVKYALMRAYIQGIHALKEIDNNILILTTEPLVNIVAATGATQQEIEQAEKTNEEQYQSVDMLTGTICPELGGSPHLLDVLGFNFYYNNQWVIGFESFLPWLNEAADPRWRPLSAMIIDAYQRYGRPIVITETSHPGEDRPLWMNFIAKESSKLLAEHVPLWGICLYPIIDRPDWDNLECWHHSGLWDQQLGDGDYSLRILNKAYYESLINSQNLLNSFIDLQRI